MIHYHGCPISPVAVLHTLAGRNFCVPFTDPRNVETCHAIGQSVMIDNGAFSLWKSGTATDWPGFYAWADRWLDTSTTWAVIPDVIQADADVQDSLLAEWPFGAKGAPVWHMHEPISRLLRLIDAWPRICIGSSAEFSEVLSPGWERRMDAAWNAIARAHRRTPNLHMLRGMNLSGRRWPFASVDSTDIARNHNRPQNSAAGMADRWDALQTPARWTMRPEQLDLEVAA